MHIFNLLIILNRINSGFLLESLGKAILIEGKDIPLQKGTDGIRPISSLNPTSFEMKFHKEVSNKAK